MLLAGFLCLAGIALPVALAAQETVFGGEAAFASGVQGDIAVPQAIRPFARLLLSPELTVFADTAELRVSGQIGLDLPGSSGLFRLNPGSAGEPLTASLDTLSLRLYPSEWLTLDLGLQTHASGAALLLSPVNYLAPVVLDLGSGGDLPTTAGAAPLAGATAFLGSGYVSLFLAPAPAGFAGDSITSKLTLGQLLASADGLLSAAGFPGQLDDPDVSAGPLTPVSLRVDDPETAGPPLARTSVELAAGLPLGPLDLTALYYHGLDRVPTLLAAADTIASDPGEFDLVLKPGENIIDAAGLSLQTTLGPALLWLDGSYIFSRSFGTTDFAPAPGTTPGDPGLYEAERGEAGHLELVAGALLLTEVPRLTIAAEYRHGFIGSDRNDLLRLDFPGTALASVTAEWLDGFLSTTASTIALIPDRSAVLIGSVELSPSSELSAWLQAPVVLARESSLLAAARGTLSVTAGLSYRF